MKRTACRKDSGRKGQMPMALIAVALLIAGAFYAVICAGIERGTDNADSANVEFGTVDDAIERAEITIESELGRIITTISGASYGTLMDRSSVFGTLSEEMLGQRFPNTCRGVTTEIEDHSLRLGLQNMRIGDSGIGEGITRASYLSATGTVDLLITSESSVTRKTLSIESDATSALPLVAEASTVFELSTKGGSSAMTQMVEYQLNALASTRVLNGYGLKSSAGEFGTSSIITQDDVLRAVRNAMNILEAMCFRDCPDGELLVHVCADLGEMIALQDGCLTIDLGALFSQSVMERVDEYALQWMEYIGLDIILDLTDMAVDALHNVFSYVSKWVHYDLDKKEIVNYIKKRMSEIGYAQEDYRWFCSGEMTLVVEPIPVTVQKDDDTITLYTERVEGSGSLPAVDILDWDGWEDFMYNYRNNTNQFRESILAALKTAALKACSGSVVRIPVDRFDRTSFTQEFVSVIQSAIGGSLDRFIDDSVRTVRDCRVSDPLMAEAYRAICENAYDIFDMDMFEEMKDKLSTMLAYGIRCIDERTIQEIRDRLDFSGFEDTYRQNVNGYLDHLRIFLEATKDNRLANGLANTAASFLRGLHLEDRVRGIAVDLAREISQALEVSPYSTVPELPGSTCFALTDDRGVLHTERLTVRDDSHLNVSVTDPVHNRGRNTHYIGIFENRIAKYSSVFTIGISGTIDYTVSSSNPVYEKLALSDCTYSGTVEVDASFDIACMSGWALAGVQYDKSNTLAGDLCETVKLLVMKMIDRLFGPIETVMKGLEMIKNACTTVMIEYGNLMGELMETIYGAISVPLEMLQTLLNDALQDIFEGIGIEDICIMLGSQSITLNVFGMKVTVQTNLRSLEKSSKDYVKVIAERDMGNGCTLNATLSLKENTRVGKYITASGGVSGGDWAFNLELDPMFSSGTHFATISGHIRDIDYSGTIPELVQYQILDVSTNDIPGVREALSNIPLPAVGFKANVEIGLYAKYDLPIERGLLINEVELNPEGNDAGREWVEIYNNTDTDVNLLGYTLAQTGSDKKAVSLDRIILTPHQRAVVYFDGQSLKNGDSGHGERILLYDSYGNVVDRTPALRDRENDGRTWQRTSDASVNWSFMPGTEDSKNNGEMLGGFMMKTVLIDFAKDAAVEVLDEMGDRVQGTDQAMEYAERVVARIVEKFIDCVSKSLVEACAFVKVELADYTQSQHFGIKVMLGIDSDIINDTLRYIASMIPVIGEHIACPEGLTAENILYQDVFLRTLVYTGMSAPKFLGSMMDDTEVDTAISVKCNLSAISTLFGEQKGKWRAEAGIVMENVPTEAVPDCFEPRSYMKSDLWLFRMTFTEGDSTL